MKDIERILLENKAWSAEKQADDAEFFKRLEKYNAPSFYG